MSDLVQFPETRRCGGCKVTKPLEGGFWKNQTICIDCSKDRQKNRWNSRTPKARLEGHLKYKYSLTMNDLILALDKQKNNCAICENALPDLLVYNNRRRGYAIDHNHETGKFRGVLCLPCNSLLGMAKENVKILQSATDYLLSRGSYGDLVEKRTNKKGK